MRASNNLLNSNAQPSFFLYFKRKKGCQFQFVVYGNLYCTFSKKYSIYSLRYLTSIRSKSKYIYKTTNINLNIKNRLIFRIVF